MTELGPKFNPDGTFAKDDALFGDRPYKMTDKPNESKLTKMSDLRVNVRRMLGAYRKVVSILVTLKPEERRRVLLAAPVIFEDDQLTSSKGKQK